MIPKFPARMANSRGLRVSRRLVLCAAFIVAFAAALVFSPAAGEEIPAKTLHLLKSKIAAERQRAALEVGRVGEMAHTPALAALLADSDAKVRRAAHDSLWKIWMRSGDVGIDAMMKRGVGLMNEGRLDGAIRIFGEMISLKPGFAEGWNKRATALWMARRYRESIEDCQKVIELNPYHFGALSGMGLNYLGLEDLEGALDAFRRTLEITPHSESTARYIEMLEKSLAGTRKKI